MNDIDINLYIDGTVGWKTRLPESKPIRMTVLLKQNRRDEILEIFLSLSSYKISGYTFFKVFRLKEKYLFEYYL